MNVTEFEKKEDNTALLTVTIDAPTFNEALNSAYKKVRGQIAVPGFRRGKAPRKIIENLYGASTFYNDALDELLPKVCAFGITEKELRTVGYPKLGDVDVQDDKSVSVAFTVALYPEIEIGEYKGIHAVKPPVEIPESAIDAEIETIRLRNATIEPVDRPAINGDTVTIDYEGSVDGVAFDGGTAEGYELTLGSNTFIPGFEAQIQTMHKGEERNIEVVFPEQYHAEELAGKTAVFKVKVHEINSKVLPEADDEFAKDVSEFDTLADYKADIRAKLEKEREADADNFFENALLEKLSETVTGDIPEEMYEEQIDNSLSNLRNQLAQYGMDLESYLKMSGASEETFRADARPGAEKQVKISLALEKIAEKETLEITDEEIETFYTETAERYNVPVETARESIAKVDAERELKMRAAIKLVRENGIADAPPAVEEMVEPEQTEKAEDNTKTKKTTVKKKAETSDASGEVAAKKTSAKKPKTAEKTEVNATAKETDNPEAKETEE